jgi:hypothetical protein
VLYFIPKQVLILRIFKNKSFARFAKKAEISDSALCKAVKDAEQGLIDADLGGGVIKQRVARTGQGKSGGYRTMILFKVETRAFFVHGFAKNEKDNIEPEDLIAFRKLEARMLTCNDVELTQAINKNILTEVICHDEKLP